MNRKNAYIEKAQAKIDEYAARIDALKAKARGEVAGQKIGAHEQLDKLETKLKAAKSKLADLTDAAGDSWEDLSGRVEELTDELGASVKKFIDKHK